MLERLTTSEVAKLLDCSTARVRQLVGDELLKPDGKIGQTYIFTRRSLDRYLKRKNGKPARKK